MINDDSRSTLFVTRDEPRIPIVPKGAFSGFVPQEAEVRAAALPHFPLFLGLGMPFLRWDNSKMMPTCGYSAG